jgi:hypothetical protein
MAHEPLQRPRTDVRYEDACASLEAALSDTSREAILDFLQGSGDFAKAIARLRTGMRTHTFRTGGPSVALERVVRALDRRTRDEGFHVLQSWDYRAHRFADDIVPVLMLDRFVAAGPATTNERQALAILLDQYFLSVLGLLAVRAWDEGDANANFDRVTSLLGALGRSGEAGGSFVDDAGLLLLLAISHYHPHEAAYDRLLERVRALDARHQLSVAQACAASLGSHLRWGFRFMYQRDAGRMRDDNVVDYPWLLFSMGTLVRAYVAGEADRAAVSEGLVNGFSADPWAFTGKAPAAFTPFAAEHAEVRDFFRDRGAQVARAFEAHEPKTGTYSPLGFTCNFLCNALVAMVATSLAGATPHPSLDELFTRLGDRADARVSYAKMLMDYSRATTGGAGATLIVYDPYEGLASFNAALRTLAT